MAINKDPDAFNIKVKIQVPIGQNMQEVSVIVDLSRAEFEKQVLAAAGRFQSLKREKVGGGRKPSPVTCGKCFEQLPSIAELKRHTWKCPKEELKN